MRDRRHHCRDDSLSSARGLSGRRCSFVTVHQRLEPVLALRLAQVQALQRPEPVLQQEQMQAGGALLRRDAWTLLPALTCGITTTFIHLTFALGFDFFRALLYEDFFFLAYSTLMLLLPATRRVLVVLRCKVILRGSSTLALWLLLRYQQKACFSLSVTFCSAALCGRPASRICCNRRSTGVLTSSCQLFHRLASCISSPSGRAHLLNQWARRP